MNVPASNYDFVIIGGGLFGAYAALYLAAKSFRVALIEKEAYLLGKASLVNQARLHGGYHYPRSVATARMSDENKVRFTEEHQAFINFKFQKYYAIDRFGSVTDASQFERFCNFLKLPCTRIEKHPLFQFQRMEALYETVEHSFDPLLIGNWYRSRLRESTRIDIFLESNVYAAESEGTNWRMELHTPAGQFGVRSGAVVNATYTASNSVHRLFGLPGIPLMHEISEIALMYSPELAQVGLTVMDGPFGSVMPFGCTGLHSVSSVAYTHHKVSYDALPGFDCQLRNQRCTPELTEDCNACFARPHTAFPKMKAQMEQYFSETVKWHYFSSLFTIKSKLQSSFIDDGRPTEIKHIHNKPDFYTIFAGKINSIYEIEKVI